MKRICEFSLEDISILLATEVYNQVGGNTRKNVTAECKINEDGTGATLVKITVTDADEKGPKPEPDYK